MSIRKLPRSYPDDLNPGKYCFGCTDRKVGCHANCEKYKSAVKEYEDFKNQINDARRSDLECDGFKQYAVGKTKNYMKKHLR